ncbi:MAG TPA: N-acetylmuramic acid 6-phosphate etherase [Armatimonadota bacterium]|jgi:N-acetylmuramic acid 6-phosphate etherase
MDLTGLLTEAPNPESSGIDRLTTLDALGLMNRMDQQVALAVQAELSSIARAVDLIAERLSAGGRLLYLGAGTSGRLGVLDASECPPTFGVDSNLVQGIIAGGDGALRRSIEGAEDDPEAGARDLKARGVGPADAVVGISASGSTPYVLGGLRAARELGAATIGLTNNRPSEMEGVAEHTIAVVTGPELISGSTRLKAGTAQKLVLNMLSTLTMVKLGRTYGNLMVDVRATNVKLRDRARRLVIAATGCDDAQADEALHSCSWEVKQAIVVLLARVGPDEARTLLERASGFVSRALELAR